MKKAWVNLRRRIARTWPGEKTPFIVVFEKTKAGFPHMHILMRAAFIPQKWLSDNMKELIDAPIVDIRAIKSRQMAFWYVTKYLGKDPHAFEGCKRWWRSHSYEVETDEDYRPLVFGEHIVIERSNYYEVAARFRTPGFEIVEEGKDYLHYRRREPGGWFPRIFGSLPTATSPRLSARADSGGCVQWRG
jgi:DNA-binding HxlR family transcriptional regulator